MKYTYYLTLAVVALALPFGNVFAMAQKQAPAAPQSRYDRILEIVRTSAAKRDAANANLKGKAGVQKGQKDAKNVDEVPLYKGIPAGPESTQEFGTADTLAGKTMRTALGTKTMRTAMQTQQFNTALQTGTLPEFYSSLDEAAFLTALQDEIRANPAAAAAPNAQGWLAWINERLGWLVRNPYGNE